MSGFCGDSVFRFGLSWKGFGIRAFVGKDSGFRGEDFIWAGVGGMGVVVEEGGRVRWRWRGGGGGSADLKRA